MKQIAETILNKIHTIQADRERIIVAIDGRCGSGKSTLAALLQESLACDLIHMDDFYLRPEQRTAQRRIEPGGNVDYERFLAEVLLPLRAGLPFHYRPYDCSVWDFKEEISVIPGVVTLVEGSYSCHPTLYRYYDLRIFLTVESEKQNHRILLRCGEEKATQFRERWIPLEELYFSSVPVAERCELNFDTSDATHPEL
ncbi:MAG: uridine kinase [Lachnospiraceae bacterium]|nr:uridine kinase [Lachnospiraceae bacterium]